MKKKYELGWIWAQSKGMFFWRICLGILSVATGVSAIYITKVIQSFVDKASGDSTRDYKELILFAVIVVVTYGVLVVLSSMVDSVFYSKVVNKMRLDFIDALYKKKLIEIEKIHSADLMTRFTTDIDTCAKLAPQLVGNAFSQAFLALIAIVYIAIMSWKMAIIIFATIPLLMICSAKLSPKVESSQKKDTENEEKNRAWFQDFLGSIVLFRVFFTRNYSLNKQREIYSTKTRSRIRLGFLEGFMNFAGSSIGFALLIITMGVGSYFVIDGEVTIGELVAMIQLTNYVMQAFGSTATISAKVGEAVASSKRLGEVFELENQDGLLSERKGAIDEIGLENISFSYDSDKEIFKNVTASFNKGRITGIIGESGSGKTTLLKLIMGLYNPISGKAYYVCDGKKTEGYSVDEFAFAPCNHFSFKATLRENLEMGKAKQNEVIDEIAKIVKLDGLIEKDGLEFNIEEEGKNLSSGQGQRIALMRALLADSPVIVLDEPTANLDTENIQLVKRVIRNISKNKICIIVTHDKDMESYCDSVYKIDNKGLCKVR